jgi:DNA-binding beta-propeller fold protein YncE
MRVLSVALVVVACVRCAPEPEPSISAAVGGAGATAARTPQPLYGGTVAVSIDGKTVLVSDPDRDQVSLVNLARTRVDSRVDLTAGSVPVRAVDDGAGHFAVALRGRGKVAFIDQADGALLNEFAVCPEPRGVTRSAPGQVLVACATGELVALSSDGETSTQLLGLEGRDVLATSAGTFVSAFRSAELLDVSTSTFQRPASTPISAPTGFEPQVAWRTLLAPSGDIVMVHQLERTSDIPLAMRPVTTPGMPPPSSAYGGSSATPCPEAVVRSGVTVFSRGSSKTFEVSGVLPVDAAVSPDGELLVVANAGNHQLTTVRLTQDARNGVISRCGPLNQPPGQLLEQPMGIAFTPTGELIVHYRVPHALVIRSKSGAETTRLTLTPDQLDPPGHRLFHSATGALACASCHPEGQEDGHVWKVGGTERRTQQLSGGLLATAPFHWKGDLSSLGHVMQDTLVNRMGGTMPPAAAVGDLGRFLDGLAAPRAPSRAVPAPEAAGRAAFEKARCDDCHAGDKLGSNATVQIGRTEAFQVPSLVGVARRGPWMHDGCAKTLRQRFTDTQCGGMQHGDVALLMPTELDDLVAWLETR